MLIFDIPISLLSKPPKFFVPERIVADGTPVAIDIVAVYFLFPWTRSRFTLRIVDWAVAAFALFICHRINRAAFGDDGVVSRGIGMLELFGDVVAPEW